MKKKTVQICLIIISIMLLNCLAPGLAMGVQTTLSLDKSQAAAGQSVTASGVSDAGTLFPIKVVDSLGNIVVLDAAISDSTGQYSCTFKVPDVTGNLTVVAGYGTNVATAQLQIGSSGSISGVVTDGTNTVKDAAVSLTTDSGAVYSAITAESGAYTIAGVPVGSGYTMTASKSGYSSGKAENISVVAGSPTSGVNITITLNSLVAKPVTTIAQGTVVAGTVIGLTAGAAATIYYTLNGDEPTVKSNIYSANTVITINQETTVKAIAVLNGVSSEVMTATYQLPTNVDECFKGF